VAVGLVAPEERIAETFNGYFANFDIRIEAGDVVVGSRQEIRKRRWWIAFRVLPDDAGFPSLEFYATHRMTNDRHSRIWADGHLEELDAIREMYGYDPKVPGSEGAAEKEYLRHNRMVAEQLREAGLYPDGDINAYLRTGGNEVDGDPGDPAEPSHGDDLPSS
jgi:hypothetical protein